MYSEISKLSFKKEDLFLVIYQEDIDASTEIIALFETEKEAEALIEILAEVDDQSLENYLILPLSLYNNHQEFLNDEEIEL